ncbi:hypothetical protein J3B02_001317 [Coemansia erecta]|nr:hypothetical protein J3B02_001317 [Coemansia erecta]KAJ2887458.1 hypothetical protein FB639_001300 [Coemansia asiatica]
MLMRIVKELFWTEIGLPDRYHRLAYLQHMFRLSTVCRRWRQILSPYIEGYLVVRITQNPRPTLYQRLTFARKQLQQLTSRLAIANRDTANLQPKYGRQSSTKIRQSDGTLLAVCSNIHKAQSEKAHTIVLSVDELLLQRNIDLGLQAIGFKLREWTGARTLCLQLEVGAAHAFPTREVHLSHEQTVQMVLESAPNVTAFYMVRLPLSQTNAKIALSSAFLKNTQHLQRLEVHPDISCSDIPPELPMLTSLTLSIETGSTAARRLPCMAAGSLRKLELYNVDTDLFMKMLESNSGAVRFSELKYLKLSLRTLQFGAADPDPLVADIPVQPKVVPVEFPRLESVHIFGYQHRVPTGLFPALARAPIKDMYIYLGIRDALQLELDKMGHLRNLRVFLPQIDAVQPVLDSVFAKPTERLHTLYIYTHMRLEGCLPTSFSLAAMRNLNLDALIAFEQVRLIITQLPRLVFLKTMVARDPNTESFFTFAETADRVLEHIAIVQTHLQVLKLWHYEDFCTTDGRLSLRAAMVTGLLASIPTLVRFRGRVSARKMRNSLDRVLDSSKISDCAGHLRTLEICEGYE